MLNTLFEIGQIVCLAGLWYGSVLCLREAEFFRARTVTAASEIA